MLGYVVSGLQGNGMNTKTTIWLGGKYDPFNKNATLAELQVAMMLVLLLVLPVLLPVLLLPLTASASSGGGCCGHARLPQLPRVDG